MYSNKRKPINNIGECKNGKSITYKRNGIDYQ